MLYLCKLIVVISFKWHLRSYLKISGRKRKFQKLFIDFDNWTLIAYQCLILTSCAIIMISLINCCLYLCTVFRRSFILYLLKGKSARIYLNFPTCKHFSKLTFLSTSSCGHGGSFAIYYGSALTPIRPFLSIFTSKAAFCVYVY